MRNLNRSKYVVAAAALLGLGIAVAAAEPKDKNVLEAMKVKTAPKLDGKVDQLWKQAKPLTIKVIDGANLVGGETDVTLRAVYTPQMAYFLVQY